MNGKIDKDDEAKKLKAFISQPVEGLLYDLDLMPEQCRTEINVLRSEAVKYLREETERLKKKGEWKRGIKNNNLYLILLWIVDKVIILALFLIFRKV